jgi:hypothetical protein
MSKKLFKISIMKTINLSKIMKKLNTINLAIIGLIQNEDGSFNCNTDFYADYCLIHNGNFIISFNTIKGKFGCNLNKLKTLENYPKKARLIYNTTFLFYYKYFTEKELFQHCKVNIIHKYH